MPSQPYQQYICRICGFIYDEEKGDPDSGLAPGTRYEDIPDDWMCPLCGVAKTDMVLLDTSSSTTVSVSQLHTRLRQTQTKNAIVIIGAGIAGWTVASELRAQQIQRPIILISADSADYYPKPTLSMAYSQGCGVDELVETPAASKAAALNIMLREHTRVVAINTQRKRILTTRGSIYYGDLVLAVGAQSIPLDIEGNAQDDILTVNDLNSYKALRQRLNKPKQRIAIIGAGLIGCELADDLTVGGFQVTLIDRATLPLASILPDTVSESVEQYLANRNIAFLPNKNITRVDKHNSTYQISFNDGEVLETDVVVRALGLSPLTRLAHKAQLGYGQGIQVNAQTMQTTIPHIYALGDCAQVNERCYAYIEPIHRQATTLAAHIAGNSIPFETIAAPIRVKLAKMSLVVYPPSTMAKGQWKVIADNEGYHLQYIADNVLHGFVLSGKYTQLSHHLYTKIKQSQSTIPVLKSISA